jgi:peroxiredoxin
LRYGPAEACAFRASYEAFTDAGADVIGISSDSTSRHAAFAGRFQLPFALLSDRRKKRIGCLPMATEEMIAFW